MSRRFDSQSMTRIARSVQFTEGQQMDLTRGKRRRGGGGGGSVFTAKLTSEAAPYSWVEVEWDDGGSDWQTKTGGRTGTTNSRHMGGLAKLPEDLIVTMFQGRDDTGGSVYLFNFSRQLDSTFSHRTSASGSITFGDREDRSMTQAEIVESSASGILAAFTTGNQAANKWGWVRTHGCGVGYDSTAHKYYQKWLDVEYDVAGTPISESAMFETEIVALGAC